MLLTPEYGLPAIQKCACSQMPVFSLLMRKPGYDTTSTQNACQTAWMFNLQNASKNKVQMLLSSCFTMMLTVLDELNQPKQAYIERIGSECVAEDIPFFLENPCFTMKKLPDAGSAEYAKVKPHKVIGAKGRSSRSTLHTWMSWKVEVPVNRQNTLKDFKMLKSAYTRRSSSLLQTKDEATNLPTSTWVGVSAKLFQETLVLPTNQVQPTEFFRTWRLIQLKLTSKMKQQLANGFLNWRPSKHWRIKSSF